MTIIDPRQLVPLGRTALRVPRVGIGLRPIGDFAPERAEDARAVVRSAIARRVTLFDTAPAYGYGQSERRLGEVIRERGRDDLVIATKVGQIPEPISFARKAALVLRESASSPRAMVTGAAQAARVLTRLARRAPLGPQAVIAHAYREKDVFRSVEASLERLATDHLDIAFVHDPDDDYEEALGHAWPALRRLRAEGAIRAIGVAMNQAPMLARFIRDTDVDVVLVAGRYTLLDRSAADELLPLALGRGVGVLVGSVFHGGLLADPHEGAIFEQRRATAEEVGRARRFEAICRRHGTSLRAAAMAFPLLHPAVTSVLIGVTSPSELDGNLAALDTVLPHAMWEELERA